MPTMKLRNVPYGTTFTAFGDQFAALDYTGGGVLVIRKEVWTTAAFDSRNANDLRGASIVRELEKYLNALQGSGAKTSGFLTMTIDLKATDGTREYGFYETRTGLLTLEQYGKYQHIIPIPDADRLWWLATPWRTPGEKCGSADSAWFAYSNGCDHSDSCSKTYGVRPVLILSPNLLVSIEDDEERGAGKAEAETYAEYRAYVMDWVKYGNRGADPGVSPLAYEEWREETEGRVEAK